MKTPYTILLNIFLLLSISTAFAQTSYAKIEKNNNVMASSLTHELNTTKDTLYLKSVNKITQVYSINSKYKREIDLYLSTNNYKLPLNNLTVGKHLLVVGESPKKIVFVIRIFESKDLVSLEKTNLSYTEN